jgi:hypothetical protein
LLELFCLQQIWIEDNDGLTVAYNIRVEKIRLDNSGENVDMAELIHAEGYNATFEFISPGYPQYNGVVERMFATIY